VPDYKPLYRYESFDIPGYCAVLDGISFYKPPGRLLLSLANTVPSYLVLVLTIGLVCEIARSLAFWLLFMAAYEEMVYRQISQQKKKFLRLIMRS
jgi:hypothetical protein